MAVVPTILTKTVIESTLSVGAFPQEYSTVRKILHQTLAVVPCPRLNHTKMLCGAIGHDFYRTNVISRCISTDSSHNYGSSAHDSRKNELWGQLDMISIESTLSVGAFPQIVHKVMAVVPTIES
jgi:hypothetical protein